jgi:hypothetical protein
MEPRARVQRTCRVAPARRAHTRRKINRGSTRRPARRAQQALSSCPPFLPCVTNAKDEQPSRRVTIFRPQAQHFTDAGGYTVIYLRVKVIARQQNRVLNKIHLLSLAQMGNSGANRRISTHLCSFCTATGGAFEPGNTPRFCATLP